MAGSLLFQSEFDAERELPGLSAPQLHACSLIGPASPIFPYLKVPHELTDGLRICFNGHSSHQPASPIAAFPEIGPWLINLDQHAYRSVNFSSLGELLERKHVGWANFDSFKVLVDSHNG
ncbi:hypothetical protein BC827DRAFT_1379581 [Russula dissimulans]|nr:hypothetical protein BC827DRAFT_1379581 [Russula dissimulans]